MKPFWIIASLSLVMVFMQASAGAVSIYTIPYNISYNASFVWVVKTDSALQEPARVSWVVLGEDGTAGSFKKIDNFTWACYFPGTCGPSPFTIGEEEYTPGAIDIYLNDRAGTNLQNPYIFVSSVKINPDVSISGGTVAVAMYGATGCGADMPEFSYTVYNAKTLAFANIGGSMQIDIPFPHPSPGVWLAEMEPQDGEYYMAIDVACGELSGGDLVHFTIGDAAGDGEENVRMLEVQPASITRSVSVGTAVSQVFTITNPANATHNLSISAPSISGVSVSLLNNTAGPASTTQYSVSIASVQSSMLVESSFNLSVSGKVQKVPLSLNIYASSSQASGTSFTLSPKSWEVSEGMLMGDEAEQTFTIENTGNKDISLDYELEGLIDSDITVDLPVNKLKPEESDDIIITLNPSSDGRQSGSILIIGNNGDYEESIMVDVQFFSDFSSEISDAANETDEIKAMMGPNYPSILDEISGVLSDAGSDLEAENYAGAKALLDSADSKLETFKSVRDALSGGTYAPDGGEETGGDAMILIVVLIVAVAGIGMWYYITRVKPASAMNAVNNPAAPPEDEGDDYEGSEDEPY
jgi:hypothetical protein